MNVKNTAWALVAALLLAALPAAGAKEGKMGQVKERSEVPEAATWNLADLYPTQTAWEEDLKKVEADGRTFQDCRGRLGRSAKDLADCLNRQYYTWKRLARLSVYASLFHDQDARTTEGQSLSDRIQKARTNFSAAVSFVEPEILAIPKDQLASFLKSDLLKDYLHTLDNVTRRREHILRAEQEEIVARTGDLAAVPEDVYKTFSTINMPFPEVTLKKVGKVTLTQANYTRFRALPERSERLKVFQTFWGAFKKYRETFASLLSGAVARDQFSTKVRKYGSDLECSLDGSNVPGSIFTNMIQQIRAGRPTLWRYLKLRQKLLGIKDLGYHDLYASIIPATEMKVGLEEAQKIVLLALAPLGSEATGVLQQGFAGRWGDIYPTAGKRSGAYMSGSAYDVHPYVLLNFNDDYESLSTLAHEFGHALHSYYSNRNQPYPNADYPTFTAEVASTVNENLLRLHLAKIETDPHKKLFLLGQYLENFRQTVFRQALFSEFELAIHQMAESGEALTADAMDQAYLKLLREYYGESEGIMKIDPLFAVEWAYIPHLYYDFYMFQYTTSFVAATSIAGRIASGDTKARDDYLAMLKAGGSLYPLELLKLGGVDMTTAQPYQDAFKAIDLALDEVEKLTEKPTPKKPAAR